MTEPVFDLPKAIADRQEREALRKAIAFSREAAREFRAPPGSMTGFHALQLRILDAIEGDKAIDDYSQSVSGILPGLLNMLAGLAGYAVASLPMVYGASPPEW